MTDKPWPRAVDGQVNRLYVGTDDEVRLVGEESVLILEVQTKFNFAAVKLTPTQAATLAATIHLWLTERAQGGCEESARMVAKMKEVTK